MSRKELDEMRLQGESFQKEVAQWPSQMATMKQVEQMRKMYKMQE